MVTSRKSGFTLIELLVVVSIISLLASIVFSQVKVAQAKGRDASRKEVAHQVAIALELYRNDVGRYPFSNGVPIETMIMNYLKPGNYISDRPYNFYIQGGADMYISDASGSNYEMRFSLENPSDINSGCESTGWNNWTPSAGTGKACFGMNSDNVYLVGVAPLPIVVSNVRLSSPANLGGTTVLTWSSSGAHHCKLVNPPYAFNSYNNQSLGTSGSLTSAVLTQTGFLSVMVNCYDLPEIHSGSGAGAAILVQ